MDTKFKEGDIFLFPSEMDYVFRIEKIVDKTRYVAKLKFIRDKDTKWINTSVNDTYSLVDLEYYIEKGTIIKANEATKILYDL